jgi:putative transposase
VNRPGFELTPEVGRLPFRQLSGVFQLRCANALSAWLSNTEVSTHAFRPPLGPLPPRSAAYRKRKPELLCVRAKRDKALMPQIQAVWQANMQVYFADKIWHQMSREGTKVTRNKVEPMMRRLGFNGFCRGKFICTMVPEKAAPCPLDSVNRHFKAGCPNQLWVSDFTYVTTWHSWQYVAFVVVVFARRIVGWRVSSSLCTYFVIDALQQAVIDRQSECSDALIHHTDRGS